MRSAQTINHLLIRRLQSQVYQPRIIAAQAHTESAESEERPASFVESNESGDSPARLNVSRLLPQHRAMLRGERPYSEPQTWIHKTEKYQRMMFGRYGMESGVDPRICFYTKEDLAEQAEYASVVEHRSIPEMIAINKKAKEEKIAAMRKREEDIEKKMAKLDQWKKELNAKIAKKEADAKAAKDRKERLIEEVRRHFGFKVDPRDDRFKEMLEQKEREDRKKMKEAKRKAKEEKVVAKIQDKAKNFSEPEVEKS